MPRSHERPPLPREIMESARRNAHAAPCQPSPREAARIAADLERMSARSEYFDRLARLNRAYVDQRSRTRIRPQATMQRPAQCAPRARERRDGSRRHLTRGGTDDSSGEPDPPPERLCDCGCGRSVAHKRADALTYSAACRQRLTRSRATHASDANGLRALDDDAKRIKLAIDGEIAARLRPEQAEQLLAAGVELRTCPPHALVYLANDGCPRCADLCDALMSSNLGLIADAGIRGPKRARVREWRGEKTGKQPRPLVVAR
jgi:hypothetical protein